jgi:poly(3-hydroxybutyrate) depolymerase
VIHGQGDPIVAEKNAAELVRQFLVFNGRLQPHEALPDPDARATTSHPGGRTATIDDYASAGRIVARRVRIPELGHAWSGGDAAFAYNDSQAPDATALFGEFFAAQLR